MADALTADQYSEEAVPELSYEIGEPMLEDVPRLLELWKEQYDFHHQLDPAYYAPFSDELRVQVEGDLPGMIEAEEPHILVAREGGTILGFITFGLETDEYYDANIKNFGVLKEILVTEEARSQGIGSTLIRRAEDHFRSKGITNIMIQCSSENGPALALYEREGYTPRQILLYKEL